MRHPDQSVLALHAGGDLGRFAGWRVARHVARCQACAAEVAAFADLREFVADSSDLPEVPWNELAADMRANIRLGLAAGACIEPLEAPLHEFRWFSGMRAAAACAAIAALLAVGVELERPAPPTVLSRMPMVEATANGIQVSAGESAVGLMNRGVSNVNYLPNAQGGMSASYVDLTTGRITVNTVYGQ